MIESHQLPQRARSGPQRVVAYLGMYGVAAVAATFALLWAFASLADEMAERGPLARMDAAVNRWLDLHGTEGGESVFNVITQFGSPLLAVSIVAAILWLAWRRERLEAIALAIACSTGVLFDNLLKWFFHRGRPGTATEFIARPTWSFPSGHAMNSIVGYGFLAALLLERARTRAQRAAIVAGAVVLVLIIGFSRLYLGVHYFSDVLGGWLAGAAWMIASVLAYRFVRREWGGGSAGRAAMEGTRR
jgi:undecaprenyl-diphosphatase